MAGSNELELVPEEDVQDFRFRELRKINFGDSAVKGCNDQRFSLLCTSNHFGFSFVGCKSGVYAFKTSLLYAVDKDENIGKRNMMADKAMLGSTHIPTSAAPIHLALSSDNLTLSVCVNENGALKLYFYDVRALATKGKQLNFFCSITLSAQKDVRLMDLQWNPGFPNLLLTVLSTGVVSLFEVIDKATMIVMKEGLFANCVCWSPKGKQLALGMKNGDIVQCTVKGFDEKRRHPQPPNQAVGMLMQVMDLHWLSSYEFAATYVPQDPNSDEVFLAFISTPTDKPSSYICSDNPYGFFDSSNKKLNKFYFSYLQQWGVLITCSSNSLDTPCFGREGGAHSVIGDGSRSDPHGSWWGWGLDEGGRVEPPLDSDDNDTHSVGVTIDYTSQEPVPINDTTVLPSSPLFLSLTDSGVLCPYIIINTGCSPDKITELMSPPKPLPNAPVRLQTSAPHSSQSSDAPPQQATAPPPQNTSSLHKGLFSGPGGNILGPPKANPGLTTTSAATGRTAQFPFSGVNAPYLSTQPIPSLNLGGGPSVSTQPIPSLNLGGGPSVSTQPTPSLNLGGGNLSSLTLGTGGNILGPPKTNPGLATTSAATGRTAQFPFSGMNAPSLSTQPTPSLNIGGGNLSLLGRQSNTSQAPLTAASQQNLFPAKPSTIPPSSEMMKALPGTSAPSTTQPPSFLSSGIASLKTTTPGPSFVQSPTPSRAPTSVVSTPRPTAPASALPPPGLTYHSTQSGLGQNFLLGGPHQPPSTAVPSSGSGQAPPPFTSGLAGASGVKNTLLTSSALPPKAGPTLGNLSSKPLPAATPVTRHSVQAATKQSPQETELCRPPHTSNPPTQAPKRPTATAETELEDGSADQEEVEKRFAVDIYTEIEKFATEMDELYDNVMQLGDMDKGTVERLGTPDDLFAFSSDTNSLVNNMQSTTREFKANDRSSDLIKEETLKGFVMYEEARVNSERKNDPKYTSLLKVRPLDSYSTKRLNDLRAFFLQISRAINEINSQLDAQLEKKYEERRQRGKNLLKAPSIQTVYSTLRDQTRIIRLQNDSMAAIIDDMKKLKLIPKSWRLSTRIAHSSPRRSGSSSSPPVTPHRRENRTPNRSTQTQGREKLRECLESIKKTPVKRVEKYTPVFASRGPSLYSSQNLSETASFSETVGSSTTNQYSEDTVHSEFPPKMPHRFYSSSPPNSERSFQSFKPDLMVSPDRDIAVRNLRGAYSALTTPQLSRQSSGPDVIFSQGQIAYKDKGKFITEQAVSHSYNSTTKQAIGHGAATSGHMMSSTGHMTKGFNPSVSVNKTNAPSPPTAKSGTIHWGSPPSGNTGSAQPKANISVSLNSSVAMPSLMMPSVPTKNEVDLGNLRRTSPHRDLSRIRPPSSADTESSLLPNTSLSVPNIAPNISVKENQFLGSSTLYASSPQVQQVNNPDSTSALSSLSKPALLNVASFSANSTTASTVAPPGMISLMSKSTGGMGGMVFGSLNQSSQSVTMTPSPLFQDQQIFCPSTKNLPSSSANVTSSSSQSFSSMSSQIKSNVTSSSLSFPFIGLATTTGTASTTQPFTLSTSTPLQFSIGLNSTPTKPGLTTVNTQIPNKSTLLSTVSSAQSGTTTSTVFDGKTPFQFPLTMAMKPLTTFITTANGPNAPVVSVSSSTSTAPFTPFKKTPQQFSTSGFVFGNKQQETSSKAVVKDPVDANNSKINYPLPVEGAKKQLSVINAPKILESGKAPNTPATTVESTTLQVNDKVTRPLSTQLPPDTLSEAVKNPSETKTIPPVSITAPVSSQPPPVSSQPPPVSSQPPPVSNQPPPVSSQPPPVSSQSPPVSNQPPPVSNQPPPVSSQPPPVSTQPPLVSTQPPPVSNQPPPVSSQLSLSDQPITAEATVSTTPSTSTNPSVVKPLTLSGNNVLKIEQQTIGSNAGSENISQGGINVGGSQHEDNNSDDDDMMGDDDIEPIDDSTGQNTVSGPSAGFGGSGFGLGKPQPKNVTANPFGTPGSSVISSTHSGLLRSSAFGQGGFQTPQQPVSISPMFKSGNLSSGFPSMGNSGFGQKATFGSPPSLDATTSITPGDGKVFGSSGGGNGGVGVMGINQSSNTGLSFGSLASGGSGLGAQAPVSELGGGGMSFIGASSSTLFSNNRMSFTPSPFGAVGGSSFASSQGGSTGGNFSGSSFSGRRK